jgi:hypothetical protein
VGPDNDAHVDQRIDVVLKMEKAQFFDKETEKVIR